MFQPCSLIRVIMERRVTPARMRSVRGGVTNVSPINSPPSNQSPRESSELHAILRALQASTNREQAAEQLGMSPRTLRQKLFEFRRAGHEVPRAYARS